MRGTRPGAAPGLKRCRFIPACAGNAQERPRLSHRPAVHPRVCGERGTGVFTSGGYRGSSPRVRGTPRQRGWIQFRFRFIPACAGNASRTRSHAGTDTVHPRVCGERRTNPRCRNTATGSSPRVRGTRTGRRGTGITPAVHPRVCGERLNRAATVARATGSSPRVRGTHQHHAGIWRRHRFIPACAGNAVLTDNTSPVKTVHPRVCGERRWRRGVWR